MTTPQAIIRAWCATCGMPEPSDGECHALEVGLAAGAQVAPAAQQGDGVEPTMEDAIALYDRPAPPAVVEPLTDAQIAVLWAEKPRYHAAPIGFTDIEFARAIEAAHGIGIKKGDSHGIPT